MSRSLQASWAVTRDNLVLSGGGGIDGAHILSPMPYFMSLAHYQGQQVPMYVLRLNTNGQGFSSNTYKDLKVGLDSALKEASAS